MTYRDDLFDLLSAKARRDMARAFDRWAALISAASVEYDRRRHEPPFVFLAPIPRHNDDEAP